MSVANFQHYMSGEAVCQFDGEDLGVNRGEIEMQVAGKYLDVHTDAFGGPEGVPADAQWLGAVAHVPLALSRFDVAAVEKIIRNVPIASTSYAYGSFPQIGTFVRQQGMARVLQLTTANETREFDVAFIRNPYMLNISTRYRVYMMTFECWLDGTSAQELWSMRNAADSADQVIGGNPYHTNYSNTVLT